MRARRHTDGKATAKDTAFAEAEAGAGPSGQAEDAASPAASAEQRPGPAPTRGASAATAATSKPAAASRAKRARAAGDDDEAWKLLALSGLAAQAPNTKPRSNAAAGALALGALEASGDDDEQEERGDPGLGHGQGKSAQRGGPVPSKRLKQSKLVLAERPGNAVQLGCE